MVGYLGNAAPFENCRMDASSALCGSELVDASSRQIGYFSVAAESQWFSCDRVAETEWVTCRHRNSREDADICGGASKKHRRVFA